VEAVLEEEVKLRGGLVKEVGFKLRVQEGGIMNEQSGASPTPYR